jgi:hypothetical protein
MNDYELDELDEQIDRIECALQAYEGSDYEFVGMLEERLSRLIRIRDFVDQGADT